MYQLGQSVNGLPDRPVREILLQRVSIPPDKFQVDKDRLARRGDNSQLPVAPCQSQRSGVRIDAPRTGPASADEEFLHQVISVL